MNSGDVAGCGIPFCDEDRVGCSIVFGEDESAVCVETRPGAGWVRFVCWLTRDGDIDFAVSPPQALEIIHSIQNAVTATESVTSTTVFADEHSFVQVGSGRGTSTVHFVFSLSDSQVGDWVDSLEFDLSQSQALELAKAIRSTAELAGP